MSFDLLAPHYRWMELVLAGRKLQDCRTAFVKHVGEPKRILILGEGNGRFLGVCVKRFPKARITCLDGSERMLRIARRRVLQNALDEARIEFVHADALVWEPTEGFDLIVTHFFLDCFRSDQLEKLIDKIAAASRPKAKWLVADFQIPADGPCRLRAQIIMRMMYVFFRIATRLPAQAWICPDEMLERNGFALRQRRTSDWGLLHTDLWENTVQCADQIFDRERNQRVAVVGATVPAIRV